MSQSVADLLALPYQKIGATLRGISDSATIVPKRMVQLCITSINDESVRLALDAVVFSKVTGYQPPSKPKASDWSHLKDLTLANRNFDKTGKIDLLLGAVVYAAITDGKIIKGLTKTRFTVNCTQLSNEELLSSLLQRFWEIESLSVVDVVLA